jgi:hypothetical protein
LHRPLLGAFLCTDPLATPQMPSLCTCASQEALVLPLAQVQCHGPLPRTALALPVSHNPLVGALLVPWTEAGPQAASVGTDGVITGAGGNDGAAAGMAGASAAAITAARGAAETWGMDFLLAIASLRLPCGIKVEQFDLRPPISEQVQVHGPLPVTSLG